MLAQGALLAGRYHIEALLGTGGAAHIFSAEDQTTGTRVALKLLHATVQADSFRAEFAQLSALTHPHLLRVHAYGHADAADKQVEFYSADLIAGSTLGAYAQAHGFDACAQAICDALSALDFLHRHDLRHGDVKPDNVLVDEHGRGTLIDLGCTLRNGRPALLGGTASYFAPELLRGEAGDARSDLYALGLALRELGATGRFAALSERCLVAEQNARPSSLAAACAEVGLELPAS